MQPKYQRFRPAEYTPRGWLRDQLTLQADGLAGNLDKIWPDVRDSAWIGGGREGWERVPYWLDGFLPLAYLLGDADRIARAERYLTAILDRQQPDGWICPCAEDARGNYDLWALFLIGKVLALDYEFTRNERVKQGLYRAMANCYELLREGKIRLFKWGKARWFEAMIPLQLLFDEYGEGWILDLARMIRAQGTHYPDLVPLWKRPRNEWRMETHIVNLGMMFKFEALAGCLFGETYTGQAEALWKELERYNGTAVGGFTGDECLSGLANNQGTELCGIVELLFSCETLYAATGRGIWADRLEKLAFNALPATVSDDMWTHQYDQSVNQIACVRFPGKSIFRTNGPEAHLFGLEPNFGCCTANFGQGWPKLAMHVFLRRGDTLHCAMMLPAELHTRVKDADVRVTLETEYPFRHTCKYTVSVDRPVDFPLEIRVPRWVESVTVDGKPVPRRSTLTFCRTWIGETTLQVAFHTSPKLVRRPQGLKAVEYGPLVFALPIETEWKPREYARDGVERKFPYCDYELFPQSEWRYGFCEPTFTVCEHPGDAVPFSSVHPRLTLRTRCARVNWDYADGYDTAAAPRPVSARQVGDPEEKELFPYGCAKLRVTETVMTKPPRTSRG